jgi:glycine/D-amino acid oxidase-like deaminating enzyme
VRADHVVLAISTWAAELPAVRRSLVVVASDVVATDPVPQRLAALGLEPGISISDSRRLVNYYRTTQDGRFVFGKGGGGLARGARVGAAFDSAPALADEARRQFHRLYPTLWDVPAPHHWRGAVDYSLTGLPFVGPLPGRPQVLLAAGFSGNGVGPSYLAGSALANLALGRQEDDVPEALRRPPTGGLPPEPARFVGGSLVRAAVARKEAAEDLGRPPGRIARALAALDPTSFVDRGSHNGARRGDRADDGPPGARPQYGPLVYAAYLRDPDGLRVEVVAG